MSLNSIWQSVYPILIAVAFFEVIIIIHEAGHFFAARLMKVDVEEFSIGMGPKVFSIQGKKTKYSLRWFLIGGYCSMVGEDEESDSENALSNKSVLQRIFVIAAGAIMNLILGFLIVLIIVSSQSLVGTTQVAKFDENSVSSSYGLQKGDVITSIDGMRVFTSTDVTTGLSRSFDDKLDITVIRNGKEVFLKGVKFDTEKYEGKKYVRMDFWLYGKEKTPARVLKSAVTEFISYTRMVFLSVHDIFSGQYGLNDLSGPVGAVSIVSEAVKISMRSVLRIMALITVNVGLFNLFPIPALDGWRLFLLVFEGIFKKKLPEKYEWIINSVGLVLLLGLMAVITFSDITKLFR